jgi:hypothetical protein
MLMQAQSCECQEFLKEYMRSVIFVWDLVGIQRL